MIRGLASFKRIGLIIVIDCPYGGLHGSPPLRVASAVINVAGVS
jgi:hypothetical protein